jgi:DNA-binding CsgD family transcriptional regulator
MPAISLTETRQDALRALLALEPAPPGDPLPCRRTLEVIGRLIPCDVIGVGAADRNGVVEDSVSLPRFAPLSFDPWDGALPLGLVHRVDHPGHRRTLARLGLTDGLLLGFDADRDHVLVLSLDRVRHRFSAGDAALVRSVMPALHRLLRGHGVPSLPSSLTGLTEQERRVLMLVAAGLSNGEVASRISVAPSTVRKHLEHAFRKLGVSNRLAAVKVFEGSSRTPQHRHAEPELSPERV